MGLEWLAALLQGDKSLHLRFLNYSSKGNKKTKVSQNSNNQTTITNTFNGNVNIVQINGPLDDTTKQQLQPLLDAFDNKEVLFLADKPKQLVDGVRQSEDDSLTRGLVRFFRPKLGARDFQLMRTGLYLKYLRENNKKTEANKLWKQITASYAHRDMRVVNLASAGYFHTYFRPLYKQLSRGTNAQAKFDKEYEAILAELTFAIFIHANMSVHEIVEKTISRATKNIKYGVKSEIISIHATGINQTKKVRLAVTALKPQFPDIQVSYSQSRQIITARVSYRNNNLDLNLPLED